ncbi:redoxin domain-containing protein [Thiomicrorhabdus sp. ZW0627]|uniref:redoxin domain-containing protein n=1 Tax=Thiomicrorhabdus sp. ZW0627 TaxID=3039774 RepID=UPI0024369C81|nr:redoxin domain-containing protein [Thiomicrorhabdus sp. ZW0627]MDG6774450.1 redoxin domain-containing protein [Thiomicrorhabdus sp. ZW0627]
MTALYFAVIFLFVAVILLGFAFFMLSRQIGILFERIAPMGALVNESGPKVGEKTPKFSLTSLTGGNVEIGDQQEKAKLVFFLSPTCPICKKMLPILRSTQSSEDWVDVVLASDGEVDKHLRFIEHADLKSFPYVVSTELGLAYRVSRLPFAVLIGQDGTIRAKGLINSREQLESLFNAHDNNVSSIQNYIDLQQS